MTQRDIHNKQVYSLYNLYKYALKDRHTIIPFRWERAYGSVSFLAQCHMKTEGENQWRTSFIFITATYMSEN